MGILNFVFFMLEGVSDSVYFIFFAYLSVVGIPQTE